MPFESSAEHELSGQFEYSADPARLDHERVHRWLSEESYWAMGRSRAAHEAAIAASRNFGIYDRATGEQLAYARVITDGVTFAWLCDVFVAVEARGHGIGVALVDRVIGSLEPLGLRRIALTTGDAHGLYEKFGFRPLDRPEEWMSRAGTAGPA
ncbi:GNAT family N-acetyltransferase [Agromyces ramosus]|uniref:GNAT superfamily N-acetyltransferase n=1 Tax=Agromyces ramosus TaxID=33879 RepID=A0ABU0R5F4_9MICO|nr:GNAT family N-acetyltransferase [Agromyces ramosus]MDQ0892977.1 GNAT superfamily N-acetyltransferase [Agromyces ramosus]